MTTDTLEATNVPEQSMAEVLAPFHTAISASGLTEEEAIRVFEQALRDVRAEREQPPETMS